MKSRKLSRSRRRVTILTATAASVAAGVALLPNWSAGAATPSDPTVDAKTRATFQKLADAVFTDRTDALVDGNRKKPTTKGFSGRVKMSSKQNSTESSTLNSLTQRKNTLAKLGEKYSKGTTGVSLDTVKVTGRTAKAQVTETTVLTYERTSAKEPNTTGFQAHHELTFKADHSGNWQLSGVRSTDQGGTTVNQVAAPAVATVKPAAAATDTPAAPRAATTRGPVAVPKTLTGGTYDYKAMAAYAEKHWSNYNPDYPNFNGQGAGGDCTNFVSQSLKAGGWKHAPGYVYDYTKWFGNNEIQSYSFVGVNEWSWFTQNAKRSTPLANVYQMQVGDVLQVDFDRDGSKDHTMIVSYVANGMPYLTYHSSNTYRRSLSSVIASYPTSYYYAYRT
ncbi:amidase domain-containing protein [Streptomyces niveiscabiei]|uniref:amidase domain-containing protein n=1 Tax=Streptomyces niveiscabiei TaxID=164115 RepID=UPI0006EBAD31|nr:amidase domain-containing protein [Streptomyces niveiscabiei]